MRKTTRRFSIRLQLLCMSLIPVLIIGLVLTIISVKTLENNMLNEALEGLQSACNLYREEIMTTGRDLTTNELEDEYKAVTGFDFTRFEGDTRAATSVKKSDGTRPIGTQATAAVIDAVINNGQEFTSEKTDVAGQEYCVAYSPIKDDSGKIIGMAFAGKPRAAMEEEIRKSILMIVIIAFLILVISVFIVLIVANRLVKAVDIAKVSIGRLADGEFVKDETFVDRNDELGDMIRDSNSLIDRLLEIVSNIKKSADTVSKSSSELSSTAEQISSTSDSVSETVQQMAKGATEQAEMIEKANENMTTLSEAIQTVALNSQDLASQAAEMSDASQESAEALKILSGNMDKMGEAVREIKTIMTATNDAVQSVNEKVDGITNIASQTNLLALNASIEAARAGEAGKGFAVVAEEIGKLATDSSHTADEIRGEMQRLLLQAGQANQMAENMSVIGNDVIRILGETTDKVNSFIDGVGSTVDGVNTISGLTEECDASKVVIVDAMSSLSAISEENAASTEETSASMQELNATINVLASSANDLNDVAIKLESDLSFFKV